MALHPDFPASPHLPLHPHHRWFPAPERCIDVQAWAKNYFAVGFRLDYVKPDGDLSNYSPDFLVRTATEPGKIWIVETKGAVMVEVPPKMARLRQWCADATAADARHGATYDFVYVDQEGFLDHRPNDFAGLVTSFTDYQNGHA